MTFCFHVSVSKHKTRLLQKVFVCSCRKSSDVPCDVSNKCWERMTAPLYNGYSLTHELFYLEIGEQVRKLKHKLIALNTPYILRRVQKLKETLF